MEDSRFDALSKRLGRRTALAGSIAGVALGAAGLRRTAAQDATPLAGKDSAVSVLYVQTADAGTFQAKPDASNLFELTLTGVAAHTVWFSDRPERLTGVVNTSDFTQEPVFTPADPPNAALVTQTDAGQDTLILELTNPRYDDASASVTYDASPLGEYTNDVFATLALGQEDGQLPEQLGASSLFVDNVSCKPDGSPCNDRSQCCSGFCSPMAEFPPMTCLSP